MAVAASSAHAQSIPIDLPAGSVGRQVLALGRLGRTSIVVPDAAVWARPVAALRGRMSVSDALHLIGRRAGARPERLDGGWRLVRRDDRTRPLDRPRRARRASPPSPADIVGPAQAEDVIVTASKRDTPRDRFAGQAVSIPGDVLELGGAGGTERLAARLSSVASTHLGAGRNKLFIRGIADSSFTGPTQATVGQYFGDLRLSYNAPDPDLRLVDLAAVEVLEGPQGTLYGAGSLGGLIRLVPNPPDLARASGSAALGGSLTAHGAPGADAQAMLNLPLATDRLGLRLTATAASEGGYIDKPLLGRTDVNRTRIAGARGALRLKIGGGWSAEVVGIGQQIRGADSQYADRDGPPLTRVTGVVEGFSADFGQAQLVVSGSIGKIGLRSSTGVTAQDLMERYDATGPDGPPRLFAQANRTRMTANETRAWRTSRDGSGWLVGLSYLRNETRLTRLSGIVGDLRPTTGVTNEIEETTLYGEAGVRMLPGLLATGGLRITRSVLDGAAEDVPFAVAAASRALAAGRTETVVLPAVSALIDLAPSASMFLRYQQGFRPGGIAIEADTVRRFRDDRVATIEAGFRTGRPAIDRLDAALTFARTSWRDIQADFIDGTGLPSTANVGDGRLWTVEANAGFMPVNGLRIEGGFTYNHSRIDEPSAEAALFLIDVPLVDVRSARAELLTRLRQIPNIAEFTARAGVTLERSIPRLGELRVDGWIRYVGPSRLGVGPVLGQSQGSYMDSGVTARLAWDGIGLTAGLINIANVRGNRFALGTPFATGRDQVTPLRPRTLRIGLDAAF